MQEKHTRGLQSIKREVLALRLVKIEPLGNGGHENQRRDYDFAIPEGWAVIPDDMECENFPFGEVEAEEIDGVMTVTKWTAGEMPEPEPLPEPTPTTEDILNAMLGVTE